MTTQMGELPKSLQAMIASCREAIENWDHDEGADDSSTQFMQEWTLRLSRGEFDDRLYWECVADDCEEAGDWQDAVSAYRKILDMPELHGMEYSKAHSAIGAIQSLFGDNESALESYHLAVPKSEDDSRILWRCYAIKEISQLLRMGRVREARKLIDQGLATSDSNSVDHLGTARLLIESAKCDLACNNHAIAAQSLQNAWQWLDALAQSFVNEELLRQATGIQFAYVIWWLTEAKRRQVVDEGESEIDALQHAIEKARLCFDSGGWRAPWHDLTLMNLLLRVADAYERHGMAASAATPRQEAEEIFIKRKFPESAKWPRCEDQQPERFALLQNWRTAFRRRTN